MAVRFLNFVNSGNGRTNHPLGPTSQLLYMQNGVELQFEITPDVHTQYRDLRPRQWSGPEAVFKKQGGPPLGTPWIRVLSGPGTGADDPMPQNILTTPGLIAYYDAPGPSLTPHFGNRTSWLHVIQNFTGWIEGTPIRGGSPERLCDVAGWYSIVSIVDPNWDVPGAVPQWQRMSYNATNTGWTDVRTTPNL